MRLFLTAVLFLTFGLRLYGLDAQSLWYDEGVTAIVAQSDPATLIRWTADDIQPPLYYLLVAGWGRLAGWSEWSLRFISAFFGTLIVPLLAILAHGLSRTRVAAILAALIAALHPLLLYYSQEARMYTMLVALGALAGYCVLRSACCVKKSRIWIFWGSYVFAAVAAIYTHYFAWFLLLALSIVYLIDVYRSRFTQHAARVLPFLLANLAVFLLYLPWLRVLFARLDADTSYWEGTLKWWEALRAVAIRFTLGETVLETEAVRLLWLHGAITLLALAALVWQRVEGKAQSNRKVEGSPNAFHVLPTTHYALLWLLVPLVAVLILAAFTPKFNARYVMVALPGLILLWSGGLAAPLRAFVPLWQRRQGVARDTQLRTLPALAGTVATGLLLSGFVYADASWFANPAFTKDQWRELAHYVRAHRQPDETVVLVSGHAWPIWRYYAPDIEPIRLPEIEILDVNAVLDFTNTTRLLQTGLQKKTGVWLVGWQDEIVDPMDIVSLQLGRAGQEQPVGVEFWGLDLRHLVHNEDRTGLDVEQLTVEPPIATPLRVNFGNQVELLGYTAAGNGDLFLYWTLLPGYPADGGPRGPDLHITGYTTTGDGLLYADLADRRPVDYTYPAYRWRPGQITVGRVPALDWAGAGALPGNYHLHLGVYDPAGDPAGLDILNEAGSAQGKAAILSVALPRSTPAVIAENPLSWDEVAPGVFLDLSFSSHTAEPAQGIVVEAQWFIANAPEQPIQTFWRWRFQEDDQVVNEVQPVEFPVDRLPMGQLLRQVFSVRPYRHFQPGEYWVEMGVAGSSAPPARRAFTVLPSTRTFTPPPLATSINADFAEPAESLENPAPVIRLLGLQEPVPDVANAGESLALWLVWQSIWHTVDYNVTVQMLDETGRPVAQVDRSLPKGSSNWLPEEVVKQSLTLEVPEEPGNYRLILALYDAGRPGLPRLRLSLGADHLELGVIEIAP